jgi:uncharacterized CHY-type Zn-finger protein
MNLLMGGSDIAVHELSQGLAPSLDTKSKAEPKAATEKMVVSCPHCDKSLKVPSDFSGNVRCPMCKERFTVE